MGSGRLEHRNDTQAQEGHRHRDSMVDPAHLFSSEGLRSEGFFGFLLSQSLSHLIYMPDIPRYFLVVENNQNHSKGARI